MDPDETLRLLRQWAGNYGDDVIETDRAQGLFEALDTWLTSGGFRPRAWTDSPEDH